MNINIRKDWTNSLCVLTMTGCILIGCIWLNQFWGVFFLLIPFFSYKEEVDQPWDMTIISICIALGVFVLTLRVENTMAFTAMLFSAGFTKGFRAFVSSWNQGPTNR